MELGNWPIKVQLGSTNSKGLPVLFQGSHQGSFLNDHCLLTADSRPRHASLHHGRRRLRHVVVVIQSNPIDPRTKPNQKRTKPNRTTTKALSAHECLQGHPARRSSQHIPQHIRQRPEHPVDAAPLSMRQTNRHPSTTGCCARGTERPPAATARQPGGPGAHTPN